MEEKKTNLEDKEILDLRKFKEEMELGKSPNMPSLETNQKTPEVIYNTHKFIYSLDYRGQIKGHIIEFTNRNGELEKIELESVEIGPSPISAKFYDIQGNRHIITFLKIHGISFNGELVWEGEAQNKEFKIIKGF